MKKLWWAVQSRRMVAAMICRQCQGALRDPGLRLTGGCSVVDPSDYCSAACAEYAGDARCGW